MHEITKLLLAWSAIFVILGMVCAGVVTGKENEEWDSNPPEIKQWFRDLMQPDNPMVSCCGEADAYYADSYEMNCYGEGDKKVCNYIAVVTDERHIKDRPDLAVGTRIEVPNFKIKWNGDRNPTGHGIIFVARKNFSATEINYINSDTPANYVYCYLPPGGV